MKKYDAPLPVQKSPLAIWPYAWPSKKIKNGEYFIHYVAYAQNEAALHYVLKNNFDFNIKRNYSIPLQKFKSNLAVEIELPKVKRDKTFLDCVFNNYIDFFDSQICILSGSDENYKSLEKKINIKFLNKLYKNKKELFEQSSSSIYNFFLNQSYYFDCKENYKECLPYIKKMQPPSFEEFEKMQLTHSDQLYLFEDLIFNMREQYLSEEFFLSVFNKLMNIKDLVLNENKKNFLNNLCQEIMYLKTASGKSVYIVFKDFSEQTQEKIADILNHLEKFNNYEKYFNNKSQSHMVHWDKQFPLLKNIILKNKLIDNIQINEIKTVIKKV